MEFQADTIIYDVRKIAEYQADERYDYASQLDLPDYTIFELISRWFNRLLNSLFSGNIGQNVTTPILVTVFAVSVLLILYFLYKKRPELFMRSRKTSKMDYDVEEENIHAIDFNKEIYSALEKRDYRLVIRMLYLQTLHFLSENELIEWQIHKTPTEYLYELKNKDMRPSFRELTNHFLQIRYGNYTASLELYETMLDLQNQIKKIRKGDANER
ncbi:MAG: DUF4129 domain-containing protein [Tannerella sp.]|jgi:hypothetical protein|nr:DUF4129 domain-containing protein [Tannerella sp.]